MSPLALQPLFLLADLLLGVALVRRGGAGVAGVAVAVHLLLWVVVGAVGVELWRWQVFGLMQLLAWSLFLHAPLLLVAWGLPRRRQTLGGAALVGAVALGLVAVDGFVIEPHWLDVTQLEVTRDEATAPVRIVLVTDIQTDRVGAYERRTLARIMDSDPDVVLFAGDYIQLPDADARHAQLDALAQALRDADLNPPLGAFAVRGDVNHADWTRAFAGTGVRTLTSSRTMDLGPLTLTALAPEDSRSAAPPVPQVADLHVVFGHAPDYALAEPTADVLLAGHVHGGQVRLPGFGPLITFSALPRDQTVGHTALPWGADLVVSRGIGLERMHAPPVRFNCRPELSVIDVLPGALARR